MTKPHSIVLAGLAVMGPVLATPAVAQDGGLDETQVALVYHAITGEPLDFERIAQASDVVRRASNFDRPDVIAAEVARLEQMAAAADPSRSFQTRVNDNISEYDHTREQFSITLFTPGYYVPVNAFGQRYQLVFANAESVRTIPMPKEQARDFDIVLNRIGRRVTNEIRFRVTGQGDPAGGVTGARVIRAEILEVRLVDRNGNVVHVPTPAAAAAPVATVPFDPATADVAGFRVGAKGKDLEASLIRLYGEVSRRQAKSDGFPGIATVMVVNELGCRSIIGRRTKPKPGDVCVTALLDEKDVVRSIRIERRFPPFGSEVFRSAMTGKYGAVADARSGSIYVLSWGPEVDARLGVRALSASYEADSDFMDMGLNRAADMVVTLHLVDAAWASRSAAD